MYKFNNRNFITSETMDAFECPICIERLQAPIRMLSCGHNYCEKCLKYLTSSSSLMR